MANEAELRHLRRCVELAAEALEAARTLPIREVVPGLVVEGPIPGLAEQVRGLHRHFHSHASQSARP